MSEPLYTRAPMNMSVSRPRRENRQFESEPLIKKSTVKYE